MPAYEYRCEAQPQHITEQFVSTIPVEPINEIACEICGAPARRVQSQTGFQENLFFGAAYGFAAPADRDAWHKNLEVQEWVGDEKRPADRKPRVRRARVARSAA